MGGVKLLGARPCMMSRRLVAGVGMLVGVAWGSATACGFHPDLAGGLTIAHPGSLRVAVAIAEARRSELLPAHRSQQGSGAGLCAASSLVQRGSKAGFTGDLCAYTAALLRLRALASRIEGAVEAVPGASAAEFSLVHVGPRLWSHYKVVAGEVEARYHVDGPLQERAVVLTDDAVLQAVLAGTIDARRAMEAGLISVVGPGEARIAALLTTALERSHAPATGRGVMVSR